MFSKVVRMKNSNAIVQLPVFHHRGFVTGTTIAGTGVMRSTAVSRFFRISYNTCFARIE